MNNPQRPAEGSSQDAVGECGGVFAVASCRYPTGMLDGSEKRYPGSPGPSDRSEYQLLQWYEAQGLPKFTQLPLLRLGDQVYVDATAGLFDPTAPAMRFERPYAQDDRHPSIYRRERGARFMEYCMLDDHEIDDNWEPTRHGAQENERLMRRGRDVYIKRQRQIGLPLRPREDERVQLWRDDIELLDGCRFFFADTRTERALRTAATAAEAQLLAQEQLSALVDWLGDPKYADGRPRFVVSPAMLLPRRLFSYPRTPFSPVALRCDNWEGYPRTLYTVLATLCEQSLSDVIFLSGDEHLSNFTAIDLHDPHSGSTVRVHSIHSSPLYAPFTFANAKAADFADRESFEFPRLNPANERDGLHCEVAAEFTPHVDGFCAVRVARDTATWRVEVDFIGANDGEGMSRTIALPLKR